MKKSGLRFQKNTLDTSKFPTEKMLFYFLVKIINLI